MTPLVIAHRGASAHALENTIPAFRRAQTDGADGVELDVTLAATGEVVVFHDDDLQRLGGRPEAISALSLSALRAVELQGGGRIPLLDEVFDEVGPLLVNVELKAPRAVTVGNLRLVAAVAKILARRTVNALVSSFNPIALVHFRALAPRVPIGLLFGAEQGRALREAWARHALRPAALHPEHKLVDAARMAGWRGYSVNVWTVDEEEEVSRLAALGVSGIITNDPARVRGHLGQLRSAS